MEPRSVPTSVDAEESRVTTADGTSLRVLSRRADPGAVDLPPLVLVHGLASNCRMWDGAAAHFRRHGVTTVAVDLRGHGRSDKPDHGYDFDTVCDDVVSVVDWLGVERAVVVGQSWGGNVVVHLAHRRPDRVHGVVAVDGGMIELGRTFEHWDDCARVMRPPALAGMRAGRLEAAIRASNGDWPETGINGTLANFEHLDDGTIRPWLSLDRHLAILRHLWEHRPSRLFADVERPVLFVPADSGDVSWTRGKEAAIDEALRLLPRARAHWFRPAHHDVHAQHPERFAEVVLSHLRDGFLTGAHE